MSGRNKELFMRKIREIISLSMLQCDIKKDRRCKFCQEIVFY